MSSSTELSRQLGTLDAALITVIMSAALTIEDSDFGFPQTARPRR